MGEGGGGRNLIIIKRGRPLAIFKPGKRRVLAEIFYLSTYFSLPSLYINNEDVHARNLF